MSRNKRLRQLDSVLLKIRAIEYLKMLKKKFTYEQLAIKLNLPPPVLNRYIRGHVLPREDRAKAIIEFAEKYVDLKEEVINRISFDKRGFFDNTKIIFDVTLLKLISSKIVCTLAEWKPEKVLTAASDGIPLATLIASELGVDMIYAKREREVGVKSFIEETCLLGDTGITVTLYIPKSAIRSRERILVVDDIIRTGETQRALVNIVQKARGVLVGIFVLIAVGDSWKEKIPKNVPFKSFIHV